MILLKIKLFWPQCKFINSDWVDEGIDSYWIQCTYEEAQKYVFPYLLPDQIEESKRKWKLRKKGSSEEQIETDFIYYLVSKDLLSIISLPWYYPYSSQWNAYCPFEEIKEIEINDLKALSSVLIEDIVGEDVVKEELIMSGDIDEFNSVIEETRELLKDFPEWKKRYTGYAKKILDNIDLIKSKRSKFREWSPLKLYLNVTNAKKAFKTCNFELRYLGQTVADLIFRDEPKLDSKKYRKQNDRDFDCKMLLSMVDWKGNEAKMFRSHFKNREPVRNIGTSKRNEEHRIESLFLSEFSKSKDKTLRNIHPVRIAAKIRFPMPTPLSGSNPSKIEYSGIKGGGIDILVRTGTGGKATNLCIMELKDENTKKEPPRKVIKQALIYATFIRELLRSNSGQDWWKLFGFSSNIPKKLVLFAACVMPSNENNDKSFAGMELDVNGDIIIPHYLYFNEEKNNIMNIDTSLNTKSVIDK